MQNLLNVTMSENFATSTVFDYPKTNTLQFCEICSWQINCYDNYVYFIYHWEMKQIKTWEISEQLSIRSNLN